MGRDFGVVLGSRGGAGGEKECGMLNEELGLKEGRKEG